MAPMPILASNVQSDVSSPNFVAALPERVFKKDFNALRLGVTWETLLSWSRNGLAPTAIRFSPRKFAFSGPELGAFLMSGQKP